MFERCFFHCTTDRRSNSEGIAFRKALRKIRAQHSRDIISKAVQRIAEIVDRHKTIACFAEALPTLVVRDNENSCVVAALGLLVCPHFGGYPTRRARSLSASAPPQGDLAWSIERAGFAHTAPERAAKQAGDLT
jgi:hypothetical protein